MLAQVAGCIFLTVVAAMAYSVGRDNGRIAERSYWRDEYDKLWEMYLSESERSERR
jgi:hypothetical protein